MSFSLVLRFFLDAVHDWSQLLETWVNEQLPSDTIALQAARDALIFYSKAH